jgi:transcriptional regulator with XRE-family HTH domain
MGNTAAVAAAVIACVGVLAITRHRFVRARQRRGINMGALTNSGAANRSRISVTDESFGARLRVERERRQISLSSIAADTKINLGLLQALERDDVSRWPAGIFRRAFIRGYAQAVGLDPVAITREFFEQYPEATDDSPREHASKATTPTPLRLSLADDDHVSLLLAQFLSHWDQRCVASVWDFCITLAIGLLAFLIFGVFWIPFAVGMICYHAASGVVLGNTPGAFLFGRRTILSRGDTSPTKDDTSETSPAESCLQATGEI